MNISVYAASACGLQREYFQDAFALGSLLAQHGHTLIFGGGTRGLMGETARGARSAGGTVIGIAPRASDEPEVLDKECTQFIYTDSVRERKALMEDKADAFIILPGGIGTLDEFFETLVLKHMGCLHKPMILLNTLGYYDRLDALLRQMADGGFLSEESLRLYSLCDTPADALTHAEAEGHTR